MSQLPVLWLYGVSKRNDFLFKALEEPLSNKRAIIVRNPENCDCWTPRLPFSEKSLEEHIIYINENNLRQAVIIANQIDFLSRCQSLEMLQIIPAETSGDNFDYTPLYEMPRVTWLSCLTKYGKKEQYSTVIDYSKIQGLTTLHIVASSGDRGLSEIPTLKHLRISDYAGSLYDLTANRQLTDLSLTSTKLKTLDGIAQATQLEKLTLSYNRSLFDVTEIERLSNSLKWLEIDRCGRIKDFSFLSSLNQLECLRLHGQNVLPDLDFLKNMKKLKMFIFSMDVEDGDLSLCKTIPYVCSVKNRKHFNCKDAEFTKIKPDWIVQRDSLMQKTIGNKESV